eukprot:scaffold109_cov389-Prasinococcus_capsulatus_cf.AAC.6
MARSTWGILEVIFLARAQEELNEGHVCVLTVRILSSFKTTPRNNVSCANMDAIVLVLCRLRSGLARDVRFVMETASRHHMLN